LPSNVSQPNHSNDKTKAKNNHQTNIVLRLACGPGVWTIHLISITCLCIKTQSSKDRTTQKTTEQTNQKVTKQRQIVFKVRPNKDQATQKTTEQKAENHLK
jgi:hypothetical protein